MSDIINTSINDDGGTWGSADTIEYESGNIASIQSDLEMAIAYLDEAKAQLGSLAAYDSQWQGKAKETYDELKRFLNMYHDDYRVSLTNLKTSVDGLESLIGQIPSARVIQEIDNA